MSAAAWRILAATTAAATAFAGVWAIATTLTGGSLWILTFLPLLISVPASVTIRILAPLLDEDDQ